MVEATKTVPRVIPKNQMFDIFSFVDHRHRVCLLIHLLNKRYSTLVDTDDPCLNQLRRKQVQIVIRDCEEMSKVDLTKLQFYSHNLTISPQVLTLLVKDISSS